MNRDFTAPATNIRWVADFAYCRIWAGFVYVAIIVDVFAQRIMGWHAATDKRTDLVLTPLGIASSSSSSATGLGDGAGHREEREQDVVHAAPPSRGDHYLPMPSSTAVTRRLLSNFTVTCVPSDLVMCASYVASPLSVSARSTVPPARP